MHDLFNDMDVDRLDRQIQRNRQQAADLIPQLRCGDKEAGDRLKALNAQWVELETEKHHLTGIDPAPYRMGR